MVSKKVVKQKPYPNHAPEIKSKQILVERDPDTDNDKKSEEVSHVKDVTCEKETESRRFIL